MLTLNRAFEKVIQISWQASVLVVLILLAQWILCRYLPARWRCAMWGLLLIRLAMPVLPESRWSLWGLAFDATGEPEIAQNVQRNRVIYGHVAEPALEAISPESRQAAIASVTPRPRSEAPFLLAGVWLSGMAMVVVRFLHASSIFRGHVRRIGTTANRMPLDQLDECCKRMRVQRPALVESPWVSVPAIYGILRPTLLLPRGLVEQLSHGQLRFVLLHELAHLKRRDVLFGWLMWLACAIHWFNPLMWWAAARYRQDRELACDAHVLRVSGQAQNREYGQTILRLMEILVAPDVRLAPCAAAILEGRSSLRERITSIANPIRSPRIWSMIAVILIVVMAMAALTRPIRRAAKQAGSATLVTRPYDVAGLLVAFDAEQPQYTFNTPPTTQAQEGQLRRTMGPPPTRSRSEMIASAVALIQSTVDSASWIANGGSIGAIQVEGEDRLIITQTEENHQKIEGFIGEKSTQIVLETKLVTGDAVFATIEQLNDGEPLKWEPVGDAETWPVFLGEEQVSRILRTSQTDNTTTILTAPRLTLFNGQQAWVKIETETAYVADLKPMADLTFEPIVQTIGSGFTLKCRTEVKGDSQLVTVNINPKVTALLALQPEPRSNIQNGKISQAFVQIPTVRVMEFNQTFAMPGGKWALFRAYGQVTPSKPDQEPEKPVLIMIRPTIIPQMGG